jgi:hypothetical protein
MRSRHPNRTAGVRAERAGTQSRCDRSTRSAGGAPRYAVEIPGVVHRIVVRDCRTGAVCKLMHVELAEHDRAGGFEPRHDFGIFLGDSIGEYAARGGRQDTGRVDIVLERDRDAVQRSAPVPVSKLVLERPCTITCLIVHHGDKRIELRIKAVYPIQIGVNHIARRDIATANVLTAFGNAEVRDVTGLSISASADQCRSRQCTCNQYVPAAQVIQIHRCAPAGRFKLNVPSSSKRRVPNHPPSSFPRTRCRRH